MNKFSVYLSLALSIFILASHSQSFSVERELPNGGEGSSDRKGKKRAKGVSDEMLQAQAYETGENKEGELKWGLLTCPDVLMTS
jgi:hypothetical protein